MDKKLKASKVSSVPWRLGADIAGNLGLFFLVLGILRWIEHKSPTLWVWIFLAACVLAILVIIWLIRSMIEKKVSGGSLFRLDLFVGLLLLTYFIPLIRINSNVSSGARIAVVVAFVCGLLMVGFRIIGYIGGFAGYLGYRAGRVALKKFVPDDDNYSELSPDKDPE